MFLLPLNDGQVFGERFYFYRFPLNCLFSLYGCIKDIAFYFIVFPYSVIKLHFSYYSDIIIFLYAVYFPLNLSL
jgi:hypothetical protein